MLVVAMAVVGAGAEVTGGGTPAAPPALRGGSTGSATARGGARGVGAGRGAGAPRGSPAARGAPRGRGGPGLRGASGAQTQKVPAGEIAPLKTVTSQKLEAELSNKMKDLTIETKATEVGNSDTDTIMERLFACTNQEARITAAKELVSRVSEVGVGGLGSLGIAAKLNLALGEVGKVVLKRSGALVALDEILTVFGTSAEPWTIDLLAKAFDAVGQKSADVSKPAKAVVSKMLDLLSDQALRLVLPVLFEAVKHEKEAVKLLALELVQKYKC